MGYIDYSHLKDIYKDVIDYCLNLNVGDKVKFRHEKQRYNVKAKSGQFVVLTKPFNPKKTYLYTIIDTERLVRGPENLIWSGYDLDSQEGIDLCLEDLLSGKIEVSHRRAIKLDVELPEEL